MTTDYFAMFGEPRRPWLDPERIKDAFHRLSRTEHPDQQAASEDADFAGLNQAQATLRDPKARLRHLLELEYPEVKLSGPSNVPAGLADVFPAVHELLRESGSVLAKKAAASSILAKALLARDEFATREKIEEILGRIDTMRASAMDNLQDFDARWTAARPADAAGELRGLYQRFAYLTRWSEQLREQLFELGV